MAVPIRVTPIPPFDPHGRTQLRCTTLAKMAQKLQSLRRRLWLQK